MMKDGLGRAQRPALAPTEGSFYPQTTFRQIRFSSACPAWCWRRRNRTMLAHCQTGKDDKARLACSSARTASRRSVSTSRREVVLCSAQWLWCGALLTGTDDAKTIVNSVLGAYGLPKLPVSTGFKLYDNFDEEYIFEYPRGWVARSNHQRKGIYFADFNTADKAVLEEFQAPADGQDAIMEVVSRAVSPANEVGGDARLILPDERRIKSVEAEHDGLKYVYIRFPSETVTRSGYQIRRKNIAVAAAKNGRMYSLLASARSDQYNKAKEELLQHIVESFRVRP